MKKTLLHVLTFASLVSLTAGCTAKARHGANLTPDSLQNPSPEGEQSMSFQPIPKASFQKPPAESASTTQAPDKTAAPAAKVDPKNDPLGWGMTDVKIVASDVLNTVNTTSSRMIFANGVQSQDISIFQIFDQGEGLACQTTKTENLADGDVLHFVTMSSGVWDQDKTANKVKISFSGDQGKVLNFECIVRGKKGVADFAEDMDSILSLKNSKGEFQDPSHPEVTDPKAVQDKTRSFKVVDAETLKKIIAPDEASKASAYVLKDGQLAKAEEAQAQVYVNKANESCQITQVQGQIENGQIYQWDDSMPMGEDYNTGVAMIGYAYKANETTSIHFVCVVRRIAPPEVIFKTFEKVLEFGAK